VAKRTLVALVVLSAVLCSSSSVLAARLHLLASPIVAFSSDGAHTIAWQTAQGAPIVVLDTLTGSRTSISPPSGCELGDEGEAGEPTAAAGRFLLQCNPSETATVLDVRSGRTVALPAGTTWFALGARYARGNNASEHQVVENLASGAVRRVGDEEVVNLDRPGAPGERAICARLRDAVRGLGTEELGDFSFRNGLFAHRAGHHGDVALQRCRGHSSVFPGQSIPNVFAQNAPRNFDLRGGLLTWDTGDQADTTGEYEFGRRAFAAKLDAVSLSTQRRRTWTLPRVPLAHAAAPPSSFGYSTHTVNAVFWAATRTLSLGPGPPGVATMSLYWARL
jgi:hypothetical protein